MSQDAEKLETSAKGEDSASNHFCAIIKLSI